MTPIGGMRYIAILILLSYSVVAEAHRSGCHRWHSCPSDSGSYICGDTGYCSQCPNNQYCKNGMPKYENFTSSPSPSIETPTDSQQISISPYTRKDWPHWKDEDGDCQNTRHEILIRDSVEPVRFKTERGCKVVAGRWIGPYTGKTFIDAQDVDIDHIVPFSHAHKNGAATWSREKKRAFANDPDNLLAVDDSTNQAKGDKSPMTWRPPNGDYWCEYAKKWQRVKAKYGLLIRATEEHALRRMMQRCD